MQESKVWKDHPGLLVRLDGKDQWAIRDHQETWVSLGSLELRAFRALLACMASQVPLACEEDQDTWESGVCLV